MSADANIAGDGGYRAPSDYVVTVARKEAWCAAEGFVIAVAAAVLAAATPVGADPGDPSPT